MHSRTKHIELKHHFVRDMVTQQQIQLEFCDTGKQLADVLTKALAREKFVHFRLRLGVKEFVVRGGDENATNTCMQGG